MLMAYDSKQVLTTNYLVNNCKKLIIFKNLLTTIYDTYHYQMFNLSL